MKTITSKAGEHWDEIALRAYGSEVHIGWLLQQNPLLAGFYALPVGTKVATPDIPEENKNLPEWRW